MQHVRIVAHRNRSDTLSIRVRAAINGCWRDFVTGVTVTPDQWDKRRQKVRNDADNSRELNNRIDDTVDIIRTTLAAHPNSTAEDIRAKLNPQPVAPSYGDSDELIIALHRFIASEGRRNTWAAGTSQRFESLAASLTDFDPLLRLSTLTAETLDKYTDFLARSGHRSTTVAKTHSLLRWFLRWANAQGLYDGDLHLSYRPRLRGSHYETKEVLYLTLDELQRIESAPLPSYYAAIRDTFCFCCYSGLRYSDVSKLRRSDISQTHIRVVTKKTSSLLHIELNAHTRAILDRYADPAASPDSLALPVASNQLANKYLKDIAQLCGIDTPVRTVYYIGNRRIEEVRPKWQLITTHCARRTFVVTALQLGIPVEIISRWTGHHDLKAMRPYIAIVDSLKASAMARFDTIEAEARHKRATNCGSNPTSRHNN